MSMIYSQCPICGQRAFIDVEGPTLNYGCHRVRHGENRLACPKGCGTTDRSLCPRCGVPTRKRGEVAAANERQAPARQAHQ